MTISQTNNNCEAIDYQGLIDSHFRYLFNPRAHWAKFTRISIFLHTVRRYISNFNRIDYSKLKDGPGFYHDLIKLSGYCNINAIGTTNYNYFIENVIDNTVISNTPIYHLNGSVNEFYDPYRNEIINTLNNEIEVENFGRVIVPFLFTQSGIKPLTTITMSKKYVELYDKFKEADIICIVGFAFNGDDGHINVMFRSLADEGKTLSIFHFGNEDVPSLVKSYQAKLRLTTSENLKIYTIDSSRKSGKKLWWETLLEDHAVTLV